MRPFQLQQRGTTLVEILVTVVILSFGLLGIAIFQAKTQVASIESYQRAQAIVLLEDMQSRMAGIAATAAVNYVTTAPIGTGGTATSCATETLGANRDKCEWGLALRGAAEVQVTGGVAANVGAMIGARGCITEIQAAQDVTSAGCRHGIYMVTVAWQGLHPTKAPSLSCGLNQYGAENYRRAISARVALGVPNC